MSAVSDSIGRAGQPRSQIGEIINQNRVSWVFEVQTYADLRRNEPLGAGSAGSTDPRTREKE